MLLAAGTSQSRLAARPAELIVSELRARMRCRFSLESAPPAPPALLAPAALFSCHGTVELVPSLHPPPLPHQHLWHDESLPYEIHWIFVNFQFEFY